MSIRIGLYDFFSQLIGGSFSLAAILYVLQKMLPLPIGVANLSTTHLLILGVIAYVLGFATSRIAFYWYRLWSPKDLYRSTIERLARELAERMEFDIRSMDWYTLLAFVKRHNLDMAQEIVQFHAVSMMLRSTSLGLLLFALIFCFEFLVGNRLPGYILLSLLCIFLSIILIQEAIRYHRYFYRSIYQSTVALILTPEYISEKLQAKVTISQEPLMSEQ